MATFDCPSNYTNEQLTEAIFNNEIEILNCHSCHLLTLIPSIKGLKELNCRN